MRKLIFIVILFPLFVIGQDSSGEFSRTIDSLKLALKNAKHDTTRCNILDAMVDAEGDDNLWSQYNEQLKQLAEKNIANNSEPKNFFLETLADALNSISYLASQKGDVQKALEYSHKTLNIFEGIGHKEGIATSLNNIGAMYNSQGDLARALEYFQKSLKIREEIGYKEGIGYSLNNIGVIYRSQGNIPKALEYFQKSLKIREEIGNKEGISNSLSNIGIIYEKKGDIPKALEYLQKSLMIREEIGHKDGIASSLNNIANLTLSKGQIKEALVLAEKGMLVAKETGYPENIGQSAGTLKSIFIKQNKYKEAFEMYELEIKMRDSINNEQTQKAAVKKQMQYQYETEARELKNEQDKKDIIAKAELKQKEKERNYFIIGFALVIVLAGFIFRSYRQKQKANVLIAKQKHEVEESRKEILDSIHYAKRIQKAHLPSENYIAKAMIRLNKKNSSKA